MDEYMLGYPMLGYLAELIRIKQWYKNLLVFLPIMFSGNLFNPELFALNVLGFFCLCFVSSSNYIINNLVDVDRDRDHPEKNIRFIAMRQIGLFFIISISILLFLTGLIAAFLINAKFFLTLLSLFFASQLYNFIFKKEIFLDIILISVNFVLRAVSGAYITNVVPSYWLIIGVFFLALFLSACKRYAELVFLQENAGTHKEVLNYYSEDTAVFSVIVTTSLLALSYVLYSFLGEHKYLFLTIPFMTYSVLRYAHLTFKGSQIARNPENVFIDGRIMISMMLFMGLSLVVVYL